MKLLKVRDWTQHCQVFSANHRVLLQVEPVLKGKCLDLCAHVNIHVCVLVFMLGTPDGCVCMRKYASGWMYVCTYMYVHSAHLHMLQQWKFQLNIRQKSFQSYAALEQGPKEIHSQRDQALSKVRWITLKSVLLCPGNWTDNFWRSLPNCIMLSLCGNVCLPMFTPLHGIDMTLRVCDVLLPKNATVYLRREILIIFSVREIKHTALDWISLPSGRFPAGTLTYCAQNGQGFFFESFIGFMSGLSFQAVGVLSRQIQC